MFPASFLIPVSILVLLQLCCGACVPDKKNLKSALLVIPDVSEFKAVLAHEFGHLSRKACAWAVTSIRETGDFQYAYQQAVVKKRNGIGNMHSILAGFRATGGPHRPGPMGLAGCRPDQRPTEPVPGKDFMPTPSPQRFGTNRRTASGN